MATNPIDALSVSQPTTFTHTVNNFQEYVRLALITGYIAAIDLKSIRIFASKDEATDEMSITTDISFPCIVRLSHNTNGCRSILEITQENT